MNIAFQSRISSGQNSPSDFNFLCFSAIAASKPEIEFLMLTNIKTDACFVMEKNIKNIIVNAEAAGFLKRRFLLDYKLPGLLKKHKADFYFSNDDACLKNYKGKQIIFINNQTALLQRKNISLASYIIVPNEYLSNKIESEFRSLKNKPLIIPGVVDSGLLRLNTLQRDEVKKEFSSENDYFLLFAENATVEKIIVCLKSFSHFKKMQKSSIKILIIANNNLLEELQKAISNYRYKEEVVIISDKTESVINTLISSAYCVIFPDMMNNNRQRVLNTMKMEVPVIAPESPSERSSFENKVLFGSNEEKILSQNMMLIYKDEETRSEIVRSAKNLVTGLSTENISTMIMSRIINATEY